MTAWTVQVLPERMSPLGESYTVVARRGPQVLRRERLSAAQAEAFDPSAEWAAALARRP